jgi:hypothetical protein
MKILVRTFVVVTLVLVALAISQAQQPQAQTATNSRNEQATVQKADTPAQNLSSNDARYYSLPGSDRVSDESAESFCAFLQTFRVKRPYRDSDLVTPAGYTTCVPSKRFELRSTVETQPTIGAGDR